MNKTSKNYINQYKLLFYLSWIILYFIFPAWNNTQIYISFTNKTIIPFISLKIIFLTYFFISAYLLNFSFRPLFIDTPLITYPDNWSNHIKNNFGLVIVCCIAAVLHLYDIPRHILSPHTVSDRMALWIYRFTTDYWHKLFDSPIQYAAWSFLFILVLTAKQKKLINFISSRPAKYFFMVFMAGFVILYMRFFPYYSSHDHFFITSEAPLGTLFYLGFYYLTGINNPALGPLIIQFTSYILSAVFLYKTILLFCKKETALLGSSIYLFSPLVFAYGVLGHLASGVVFFIILISYLFLKFIRDGDNKDLILTVYFTSIGSLYKREIILMFLICSTYFIFNKIKQKDVHLKTFLKVLSLLSLSLLSFLPWYFIGTRAAGPTLSSSLSTLNNLFSYFSMIPLQISWPVFILFLLSIIFVLFNKRNPLSLFFGLVFILYYLLFSSLTQQGVHRYAIALYPSISVFLALFIRSQAQKFRWKHAYKVVSSVLIIYLAILCIIPRSNTDLITFKYTDYENQSFPYEEAFEWVINKTGDDEKVLVVLGGWFAYKDAESSLAAGKIHFLHYPELSDMASSGDFDLFRQGLKDLCKKLDISYIMFPGGDAISIYPRKIYRELEIKKYFEDDKYDDLVTAAKFSIDDNYVYVSRLRESFIEKE